MAASLSLADSIRWTGSVDGNWDTTTANWTGDDTTYEDGDDVTFADDPPSAQDITITPSAVEPNSVTFSGSSVQYTLGAAGEGITGDCRVRISNGNVTLRTSFTNNTYTDGTTVRPAGRLVVRSDGGNPFGTGTVSVAGTLELSGAKGSLVGSGSLILIKDGELEFDDGSDHPTYYTGDSGEGRWGDGEPIRLNSGTIQLICANIERSTTTLSRENTGTVNSDGGSMIHIQKGRGGGVLTAAAITRTNRGCLVAQELDPLYATVEKRARVCIDAAESMMVSNMFPPWIAVRIGWPASFASYNDTLSPIGDGVAVTSEVGMVNVTYTGGSDLDAHDGANTDYIVRHTSGNITLNNDTRIRALSINDGSIAVSSGKTLTISSGGIIINGQNHTVGSAGGRISFEDAEGVVWATGGGSHNPDAYKIAADLLGSNGLTICELTDMALMLFGNNSSLSGPITLNYGTTRIQNANGVPDNQDLRVAGGATLNLYDQDSLTVNNLTGRGTIRDTTPTASLTVKGTVNPGDDGCGILTLSGVNMNFDPGSSMVVDAPGSKGYAGEDFDKLVSSGQVTGITNANLIVNPPEDIKPRPMKGTEYQVIQCANDLTGHKFKRITYPSPWKIYARGTTNGIIITFSTIQGSVITVF